MPCHFAPKISLDLIYKKFSGFQWLYLSVQMRIGGKNRTIVRKTKKSFIAIINNITDNHIYSDVALKLCKSFS